MQVVCCSMNEIVIGELFYEEKHERREITVAVK